MFKRALALPFSILILAGSGCAGSGTQLSFWPFEQKTNTSGVLSPSEQVKALRDMAKKASSRTDQEKREISVNLATLLQKEGDSLIRAEIIHALGKFPTAESLAAVRGALNDPEADVRVSACQALGNLGGPDAVVSLTEVLRGDVDADVRLAAARALGQTREQAAIAALGTALEDSDPSMQYLAVTSLKNVTGKNLGDDVRVWQQYVKGETPQPAEVSVADRMRQMFR